MLTIQMILLAASFLVALANGMGKAPLWPAVILICVSLLLLTGVR